MEYLFWKVNYVSFEGNDRWYMVRTPDTWDSDMVFDRAVTNNSRGGVGDDPCEIIDVETGWPTEIYTEYDND